MEHSIEELRDEHGRLYSNQECLPEHLIEEGGFPLHDADGETQPVYDEDGNEIERVSPVASDGHQCGVLINLETADELLESPNGVPYENPDDMELGTGISKYPLACLRGVGQVQARRPLPHFSPVVEAINDEVAMPSQDGNPKQALFSTSFQAYNRSIHNIAPRANEYKIKVGMVTAAMGGRFARAPSESNKATNARNAIDPHLPHQMLRNSILDDPPSDLRVEQVFVIHFDRLQPPQRHGRWVIGVLLTLRC